MDKFELLDRLEKPVHSSERASRILRKFSNPLACEVLSKMLQRESPCRPSDIYDLMAEHPYRKIAVVIQQLIKDRLFLPCEPPKGEYDRRRRFYVVDEELVRGALRLIDLVKHIDK